MKENLCFHHHRAFLRGGIFILRCQYCEIKRERVYFIFRTGNFHGDVYLEHCKKINTRCTNLVPISDHTPLLEELSQDDSIPKFATHLIYLTKSPIISKVEGKIIKYYFLSKTQKSGCLLVFKSATNKRTLYIILFCCRNFGR